MKTMSVDISIVIPLYNEEESLPELIQWIDKVVSGMGKSLEVILIDDGSTDSSWNVITNLQIKYPFVKGIKFRRNYGKSAGLNVGFEAAQGDVVFTMDADLQDSPDEIPEMYRMIKEDGFDLVSGWKKKRFDPITKTIPTKLYNWATRSMSGIKLNDFNCGLKAYRHDVVKCVEVYGDMHRYIPVLAKWSGFRKIGEKVVQHQERKYGVTKFGMSRFINGPLDLLSIIFVSKFGKKPMHLFGALGLLNFTVGFAIAVYLAVAKFVWLEYKMTERPLFYFGLLAMIIGTQLFLTGFLAEMVSRNASNRNHYLIGDRLGFSAEKPAV
ncbi:MAG: glycosyltransferase involved in cell wall biosynthesis [Granulosicoccus sp.]|jgi:glycosyltransferase involved in cell wall biosynthesis